MCIRDRFIPFHFSRVIADIAVDFLAALPYFAARRIVVAFVGHLDPPGLGPHGQQPLPVIDPERQRTPSGGKRSWKEFLLRVCVNIPVTKRCRELLMVWVLL